MNAPSVLPASTENSHKAFLLRCAGGPKGDNYPAQTDTEAFWNLLDPTAPSVPYRAFEALRLNSSRRYGISEPSFKQDSVNFFSPPTAYSESPPHPVGGGTRSTFVSELVRSPPSGIFSGLQGKFPENGNYSMNKRRLSGIFARKVRISPAQRLCDVGKARGWRAFELRAKDIL